MTADRHIVYATTSASPRRDVRVSEVLSYDEAIALWTTLDEARRAGKLPQTAFFSVRHADDGAWPSAAPIKRIYTAPAKEHRSKVDAAKIAALRAYRERGGDPGSGGWFYEIGSTWKHGWVGRRRRYGRTTLAQGYDDLVRVAKRRGWIVETAAGWARVLVDAPVEA